MSGIDWGGLAGLLAFLVAGFGVIPLDGRLERRRRRRYFQARRVR